jgi:hypothetical protein
MGAAARPLADLKACLKARPALRFGWLAFCMPNALSPCCDPRNTNAAFHVARTFYSNCRKNSTSSKYPLKRDIWEWWCNVALREEVEVHEIGALRGRPFRRASLKSALEFCVPCTRDTGELDCDCRNEPHGSTNLLRRFWYWF